MIDLVITHLTHPWGPLWTLETLGDMLENYHFGKGEVDLRQKAKSRPDY